MFRSNTLMSFKKDLDKFKKNELKTSKSRLFFYFPRKSRYNCWATDVFLNIVELLLLLYYTSMIQAKLLCCSLFLRFFSHLICTIRTSRPEVFGVLRKRCSENMQHIYRRIPMPKCDLNYWNLLKSHFGMGVLLQIF